MLMGLFIHFYIIFGTNLLTEGPVQIAVFLPIFVFRKKGISNGMKPPGELFFWNKRDLRDLEWTSRNQRGGHKAGRRACPLGAPPPSWAPRSSTDLLLPPIYTHILRKHPGTQYISSSAAASLYSHQKPIGTLFRHPARGGSLTGGHLHHPGTLHDEEGVVHPRG